MGPERVLLTLNRDATGMIGMESYSYVRASECLSFSQIHAKNTLVYTDNIHLHILQHMPTPG